MIFSETTIPGAYLIELEPHRDDRGFFARSFCKHEFEARDLQGHFVQCNISFNAKRGTLRGMHYQAPPFAEVKLVRCISGFIYDVVVDLRRHSPAFGRSLGVELSDKNRSMLYIPKGLAHGFVTLADNTEVFYQMGGFHHPESARGFRWNDPLFNIQWPIQPIVISERDQGYADLSSVPEE